MEKHFRTSFDDESRVEGGVKVTTSCCCASRDQGSQVWRYIREALSELAWAAGRARPYDCPNHPVCTNHRTNAMNTIYKRREDRL